MLVCCIKFFAVVCPKYLTEKGVCRYMITDCIIGSDVTTSSELKDKAVMTSPRYCSLVRFSLLTFLNYRMIMALQFSFIVSLKLNKYTELCQNFLW
jgi:hypothetical protein